MRCLTFLLKEVNEAHFMECVRLQQPAKEEVVKKENQTGEAYDYFSPRDEIQ